MRNKGNALNKDTTHPKSLRALGFLYIALNLGTFLQIGSFNISWLALAYLVFIYCMENQHIRFTNKHTRNVFLIFILWCVYALMQAIFVTDFSLFITFYQILVANVFVALFSLLIIRTEYELRYCINAFSIAIWLNILAAGWEYFTGHQIIRVTKYSGLHVVCGFIGNFNDFCTFMFIGVVIFSVQFLINRNLKARIAYAVGIACAICIIFYDGARGAIFALYVLGVLWPVFFAAGIIIRKPRIYNAFIVLIAIMFAILICVLINKYGVVYLLSLLNREGGNLSSDIWRYHAILKCLSAFEDSLGVGIGSGQTIGLLSGINVHNFYVEILTEYGLLVGLFAIYLSFVIFLKRKAEVMLPVDALFQATGFALIVANVTSSSSNKMRAMWILLILVFIIKEMGLTNTKHSAEESDDG